WCEGDRLGFVLREHERAECRFSRWTQARAKRVRNFGSRRKAINPFGIGRTRDSSIAASKLDHDSGNGFPVRIENRTIHDGGAVVHLSAQCKDRESAYR